ncbi:MAG TPA: L,D-transpeptidase [Actinomycetota bacterium]|nr:L,D-transpeptidase [Actinomycetota bacterium]
MSRILGLLAAVAALIPGAAAVHVVNQTPQSALVVPNVQIATAGEPIRLTPQELGVRRTPEGLQVDDKKLDARLIEVAKSFTSASQASRYELTKDGVILHTGQPGVELDMPVMRRQLLDALEGSSARLELPVREVPPAPPPKFAIVVKLRDFRLELYEGITMRQAYPVGVGELKFPTPPGAYYIREKAKNPTWRNPGSGWARTMPAFIPPGPKNPLGTRAMRLDRQALVIHGTPNPASVGRRSSHGCIRMRKPDVENLFDQVPTGTPVFIVP